MKVKNGPKMTTYTATPKYHCDVVPTIIAASSARPATGRVPHFIIRAARIALLIFGRSSGSGGIGRILQPLSTRGANQLKVVKEWSGKICPISSARYPCEARLQRCHKKATLRTGLSAHLRRFN